MLSLGLGGSNHDFSACLVEGGDIVSAIEEERLSRRKYAVGVNSLFNQSWRYCLESYEARLEDVEAVVADDTLLAPAYFPLRSRTTLIRHHLAHASSAYYPSPFARAAIIVVDGAGSLIDDRGVEVLTTAVGEGTRITEVSKVLGVNWSTDGLSALRVYQAGDSDHSLGFMYKAVSKAIGFVLYEDQDWYLTEDGKTMGLAPYGGDRYCGEFRKYLNLLPDGRYELHLKAGGLLDFIASALDGLSGEERFRRGADLAFAAQNLLEETLLHVTRHLHAVTGLQDLCLAGGVALNCVANGRLLRETPFTNIYVQPAAGDGGCAVGAAYYGYHVLGGHPRDRGPSSTQRPSRHAYYGRPYADAAVVSALDAAGLPYAKVTAPAKLAATLLSRSSLIGWFTGGSEFGPRALGHRSILADPRRADMKDILNERVKHREGFRPFAPAVLAEQAAEYFDLAIESPYMLLVAPVRQEKQAVIPSVVHVDGTARVQTVTRADNGRYRELIEWFHRITDVPVVLNTSFNDRGEPIVETPEQALAFFGPSRLDHLIIEDYVVAHSEPELAAALALLDPPAADGRAAR
ncbi:carbamoyltransferase family protein [Actinoplanes derwentensis]|uniref:Carbamoyltransferase n=1 Tax=Actinoplanes derwentensis TaxID=113562 RepID=A0A1H2DDT9_9ACTN|nr:carbamoyltransferase C-terminal domain-containing protein [Actinoplanes derwentensis]GID90129.1 carbamoyltransferase [Actinoplanes derwentensis]SDT80757.1 carbamoyltransferase [Actinoplanes derwentensis]